MYLYILNVVCFGWYIFVKIMDVFNKVLNYIWFYFEEFVWLVLYNFYIYLFFFVLLILLVSFFFFIVIFDNRLK